MVSQMFPNNFGVRFILHLSMYSCFAAFQIYIFGKTFKQQFHKISKWLNEIITDKLRLQWITYQLELLEQVGVLLISLFRLRISNDIVPYERKTTF